MQKVYLLVIPFLVALLFPLGILRAEPFDAHSLSQAKAWIGKYPFNKVNGITLFELPAFKEKMLTTVGEERFAVLESWFGGGVNSLVKARGDILFLSQCMAHNCHGAFAETYVDLDQDTIFVCWRGSEDSDLWLSSRFGGQRQDVNTCFMANDFDAYDLYGTTGSK